MTIQQTNETKFSRRAVLGGGAAAVALTSVAALGAQPAPSNSDRDASGIPKLIEEQHSLGIAEYSTERGAGILHLIRQLDMHTCKSNELDAIIMADKNRPDIAELRASEAACEAEIERLIHAIANYECRCVEDVLYQLAYFTDTDAYAEDKTTNLCEFGGNKNQYTKIMKNFAQVLGSQPIDTVHGLLSPTTRSLGY